MSDVIRQTRFPGIQSLRALQGVLRTIALIGVLLQTCAVGAQSSQDLGTSPATPDNDLPHTLSSPDENVSARLFVDEVSRLHYQASFHGREIVLPSAVGIIVEGFDLGDGVRIQPPTKSVIKETYSTRGHHATATNHCMEWKYPITHLASGKQYAVHLRVYDDGVAYRYVVPGTGTQHVDGESSSWKLPAGLKAWFFERNAKKWKLKSYAGEWISADIDQLPSISPSGPVQGTPVVFELPEAQGYVAVTKAATSNYSGMRLRAVGERTLVADFSEGDQGFDVAGIITTPWRVTLFADNLTELATSDLVNNLNPAPDPQLFADTRYIKPGRCVWSWETLGLGTPATQRSFIDLAAEMGYEYSLVDDGWKDWDSPWQTIKSLCDHGRSKDVGVWVWVHSQDILDPIDDYQSMQQYFDRVRASGAVGIKIDFMNGESKELIDFEIAALRLAAERKLMVNFHGCHASTGEARTWPNEMTREGIRGIEVNKMREGPLPASHNAALPFTRFVVGQPLH